MSQPKRTIKTDNDNQYINELCKHIEEKHKISKDTFLNTIDAGKIDYKLTRYNISIDDIDNQIEATIMNTPNIGTLDAINQSIKIILENKEKEEEENNNIKKETQNKKTGKSDINNIKFLQENNSSKKNAPAKNFNIAINEKINVKYNTSTVFNAGDNKMETQFNTENPEFNESQLNIISPYGLLPKDWNGQKNGYKKYFSEIREKFLKEQNIIDDKLLEINKFVLFIAFDVIDAKPSFDDLIGIDPLNDYKKYILKINTNNNNLFLVSGQIIYIEGNLVENGKVIEVRTYKNIYEINEYSLHYDEISYFYKKSSDPYAIYYMNGPYFSKDNIELSVFNNVIKQVAIKNPHFFIVNGPFFSTENEKVKWGECDTEKGMNQIINILKTEFKKIETTRTKILICPGISDNENFYPLPQPPFDKVNDDFTILNNKISDEPEIYFISNPQIFPFNEAYIGVANFDTIKDIIFNSIHSQEINTVDKACEMILYQKNFYPVLPNTLQFSYENNQEKITTVDLSQYKYLNFDNYESPPDIILTNSAMKSFAKKIHGTVFINCGPFIKGKNYGEIAKITLNNPLKNTDIHQRLKVDFIKINQNNK